jgi:hypothetical protein
VRLPLVLAAVVLACLTLTACEGENNPANPTPASLSGTLEVFGAHGISLSNVVSGDPGCPDQDLAQNAVGFDARGLDQTTPTRIYLYGFRNRATYERLLSTVDACAKSYVTDPSAYGSVQVSPFVLAGPGPWAPQFGDRLREALTTAAGNGG